MSKDPIELVAGWAVPSGDTHHAKWIAERGAIDHDWQLLEFLWPFLKRGSTVLDIGAHCGTHTIPYMRAVGSEGAVIALEPSPVNFCCLLFNMMKEASQWDNPPAWHAEMMAAGDENGFVGVWPDGDNHGATFCTTEKIIHHWSQFPSVCRVASLRHLLLDLNEEENVSFIKIDVEGYETKVIRSLYLVRSQFTLFVEVNRGSLLRAGSSVAELYSTIATNIDPSKSHTLSIYQTGETLQEVPFEEPQNLSELEMYDLLITPKL